MHLMTSILRSFICLMIVGVDGVKQQATISVWSRGRILVQVDPRRVTVDTRSLLQPPLSYRAGFYYWCIGITPSIVRTSTDIHPTATLSGTAASGLVQRPSPESVSRLIPPTSPCMAFPMFHTLSNGADGAIPSLAYIPVHDRISLSYI